MYANELLKQEHRVIEAIVPVLEEAERRLRRGEPLDADILPQIVDFMRTFADRCHHLKEEQELFPMLREAGAESEGGLLGALVDEHRAARQLVERLSAASQTADLGAVAVELGAVVPEYVRLLKMHIEKEDVTLMPLVDRSLSARQQMALAVSFEDAEDEEPCRGAYEHYRRMVRDLRGRLGLG